MARSRFALLLFLAVIASCGGRSGGGGSACGDRTCGLYPDGDGGVLYCGSCPSPDIQIDLPPDPSTVAPAIDPYVPTDFCTANSFLFEGADAIQFGVVAGAIPCERFAILRGRAVSRELAPLPRVMVSVLGQPQLGATLTRADGWFDLGVSGGGPVTLRFEKSGHVSAQRTVETTWQEFAPVLDDVALVELDSAVTIVDLGSTNTQIARGSAVNDSDGDRRATVIVPAGTGGELVLADGTRVPLATASIRATELTVGPSGHLAMPAGLPPTTAYTYALELSVDEAIAAGGETVEFDRPLASYQENFLGFPVGSAVPAGFYDRSDARWEPAQNGRVVEVLAISAGLALVDVDGDGAADDDATLAALGIDVAERESLAGLYAPGATLWRIPIPHFTPWDYNFPYGYPPDAVSPAVLPPPAVAVPPPGPPQGPDPCNWAASIIGCLDQTLAEMIPIVGTPYSLVYRSDRVPGRGNDVDVPLTGSSVPASLERTEGTLFIAGQRITADALPQPGKTARLSWNGRDAYGRVLQGEQAASVRVSHYYPLVYYPVQASFEQSFGRILGSEGSGSYVGFTSDRGSSNAITADYDVRMGGSPRGDIGGWGLDVQHTWSSQNGTLHHAVRGARTGPGSGSTIKTIAGNGGNAPTIDGAPALSATFNLPTGVDVGPDGSIYVADRDANLILRIRDGVVERFAGTGIGSYGGDGGPATAAFLNGPFAVKVGADGSVYISDPLNYRIRKVGTDGVITSLVGTGVPGFSGDGGPAIAAQINLVSGMAVGADGSLYLPDSQNHRLRRVGTDGVIRTIAGTGIPGFSGDGDRASLARLSLPQEVAIAPNGAIYVSEYNNARVRRIGIDGIISTYAGDGLGGASPDGVPATAVSLYPFGLDAGPDGSLYLSDGLSRMRQIRPDGIIRTVAGSGTAGFSGDKGLAGAARLSVAAGIAVAPDGTLVIADKDNRRIRRVTPGSGSFARGERNVVPLPDGSELYAFDATGRHRETLHPITGATLLSFTYDGGGRLTSVTDADANVTTIERSGGVATAIVAPGGQRTTLAVTGGWLDTVTNPAGESHRMGYDANGGGLLASFADPRDNESVFGWDASGKLISDQDAAGGIRTLASSQIAGGRRVSFTTPGSRTLAYDVTEQTTGAVQQKTTLPSAGESTGSFGRNGVLAHTDDDGMSVASRSDPDPRFGIAAYFSGSESLGTPGGKSWAITRGKTATLSDPQDPLSMTSATEQRTVGARTTQTTTTVDVGSYTVVDSTPAGHSETRTYTSAGKLLSRQFDSYAPVALTYDGSGRISTGQHGTINHSFTYGADGWLATHVTNGQTRQFVHDAAGRPTSRTSAGGAQHQFVYDASGNLVRVVMPNGASHELFRDVRDRETGWSIAGESPLVMTFDTEDRPVTTTLPSGRMVTRQYDLAGRLTAVNSPEAASVFTWVGSSSRPATMTRTPIAGPAQTVTNTWDGALPVGIAFSGAANGTFVWRYDSYLQLVGVTLDAEPEVAIVRDTDGLVVTRGAYTFTRGGPLGAVTEMTDGTLVLQTTYDTLGRVASRAWQVGVTVVHAESYQYDAAGRISQRVDTRSGTPVTLDFTYDADGQLFRVDRDGVPSEEYAYDLNRNRISRSIDGAVQTATYNAGDRILTRAGVAHIVSADGHVVQRGADVYVYGARGELLSATVGGSTISYAYDSTWRRVSRTDAAGTWQFLYGDPYDDMLVTAARTPAGELVTFTYDDSKLLYEMVRGGVRYYVSNDLSGAPSVVFDGTGAVVKSIVRDAFGAVLSDSNPAFEMPIATGGGIADPATGLVRIGLRDYEPIAGRWTAVDPLLFHGLQTNLWAYVNNDPVNFRDRIGGKGGKVSLCAGVCAGVKIQRAKNGTWSLCTEIGGGLGGGVEADFSDALDPAGVFLVGEVKQKLGVGSVGWKTKFCPDGTTRTVPVLEVGPIKLEGGKEPALKTGLEKNGDLKNPLKPGVGLEAKLVVQTCSQWFF